MTDSPTASVALERVPRVHAAEDLGLLVPAEEEQRLGSTSGVHNLHGIRY
jgi:hypothetical protein